jgi:hypothetical protein
MYLSTAECFQAGAVGEKTSLPAHLSHTIRRLFSPLLPHILREVSPLILVVLAFVVF